jgi:hypothetical protein
MLNRDELSKDILLQLINIGDYNPIKAVELADSLIEKLSNSNGFCPTPDPLKYLFVATGDGFLWYFMDGEKQVAAPTNSLEGVIKEIRLTNKEYKGKENTKLEILLLSGKTTYCIRTGVETNFAKCFLLAVENIPDLTKPIILSVAAGEEKVVFCRVWDAATKAQYKSEWRNIDAVEMALALVDRIAGKSNVQPKLQAITTQSHLPQSTINRDLLIEEISSLLKRKNMTTEQGQQILIDKFGVKARSQLSDKQLVEFRDLLSNYQVLITQQVTSQK